MVDSTIGSDGLKNTIKESLQSFIEKCNNDKEKGDTFVKWAIRRLYKLTTDDAENATVDGWNDGGIDACFPLKGEDQDEEIYIVQGKFGKSHNETQVGITKNKIEKLLKTPPSKIERPVIAGHIGKFREAKVRHLIYITDQEFPKKQELISLNDLPIDFQVMGIGGIRDAIWESIQEPAKGRKADLNVEKAVQYKDWYIAIVGLSELGRFVERTRDYVFESNIRQWLKFTGRVNKGIKETLQTSPGHFFKYNNGITIVAAKIEQDKKKMLLHSPQIVNGAQTSNAIWEEWTRNNAIEGHLSVTLIKGNMDEIRNITKYRNSQNAVNGKDLVSLLDFYKDIQHQFKEKGYDYEIQSGKFDTLKLAEKVKFQGNKEYNMYLEGDKAPYSISSKDAVQAFIAGIIQSPTEVGCQ